MTQHLTDRLAMTAIRDLDAAGPESLSEDERARADATFSRIVATPVEPTPQAEPERARRRRLSRRLLVGVGLAGAPAVASSALLFGGTAYGSWTPTPEPLRGDAATEAADSCRTALEMPDRGEQVLIAERRGDWTYVRLGSTDTAASCLLPDDMVGRDLASADYDGHVFGMYDPDWPPAPDVRPDEILEYQSMSGATDEGMLKLSEGYVGTDVVGVTVHTPTGLEIVASVAQGRFAAWWPAGATSGYNREEAETPTFVVTLADGSTRESTG